MGRVAVRAAVQKAIQTAVTSGTVPYVGTVYPARQYINGQDYETNAAGQAASSTSGSSAVLVVNIPSDKRQRRADTGRAAVQDTSIHPISVEVFFANTGGTPVIAQQEYDAVIDGLFVEVRTNPLLSAPTVIWSAGEYAAGVTHRQAAPYVGPDGTTVFINGVVEFEAWEWIAGTGV